MEVDERIALSGRKGSLFNDQFEDFEVQAFFGNGNDTTARLAYFWFTEYYAEYGKSTTQRKQSFYLLMSDESMED